jgi:hypothetical protein
MYEASPNQIRHWRHYRRFPESPALNMTVALLLEGRVERLALQRAAAVALSRHETLTARPVEVLGRLYWRPVQAEPGTPDMVLHVECKDADDALAALHDEAGRPFALKSELPVRVKLLSLNPHRAILVVNIHHIACDDWSVDLLIKEIATLYASYRTGTVAELPPTLSYENFSQYQKDYSRSAAGVADALYWAEALQGAKMGVGFTSDIQPRIQPRIQSRIQPNIQPDTASSWPRGRMAWAFMSADLSESVRAAATAADVTPFVFLMAGFARLLARSTGETDLVVGVPYPNRLRPADAGLVGFIVNTLPLRFRDAGLGSAEFIRSVAVTNRDAFAHQRLPYYQLLSKLGPEFESGAKPVFRTMFVLRNSQSTDAQFQDIDSRQCRVSTGGAREDQTWTIEERDGTYTLDVEWNADLHTETSIRASMEQYRLLLHALVKDFVPAAAYAGTTGASDDTHGLQWPAFNDLRDVFSGPVLPEHGRQPVPSEPEFDSQKENSL